MNKKGREEEERDEKKRGRALSLSTLIDDTHLFTDQRTPSDGNSKKPLLREGTFSSLSTPLSPPQHSPTPSPVAVEDGDKKMCLVVDSRSSPNLLRHLIYMAKYLPSDWPITLMYTRSNEQMIHSNAEVMEFVKSGVLNLHHLGTASIDQEYYNVNMLANASFWRSLTAEHVLLAESDSVYCPNSPHRLDDFLEWGFIGPQCANSGFSMWRRSNMICLMERMNYSISWGAWPDVFISRNLEFHKCGKSPTREICDLFAFEVDYVPKVLGMHNPIYSCSLQEELFKYCPELQNLPNKWCL